MDKPQRSEAQLDREYRAARQKFKAALAKVNEEFESSLPAGVQRAAGNREGMQRLGSHIIDLIAAYDRFSISLDARFAESRRFGELLESWDTPAEDT